MATLWTRTPSDRSGASPLVGEEPAHVRAPRASERSRLVDWLDDGLRDGRRGRLEAEYPLSMHSGNLLHHRAVFSGSRPLSHAMLHRVTVRARKSGIAIGLIGNVYTDPGSRGRGLGGRCVDACAQAASQAGLPLVLLWSERDRFYERLSFHSCGREGYLSADAKLLRRASLSMRGRTLDLFEPEGRDYEGLEELYAAHAVRVDRSPGDLRKLASAPDCEVVAARSDGRIVAYAARGRGDDFPDVVHEWAGDADGVLACVERLCRGRSSMLMLTGPTEVAGGSSLHEGESPVRALLDAGAIAERAPFARARLLDAPTLWQRLGGSVVRVVQRHGRIVFAAGAFRAELSERQALRAFFEAPDPGEPCGFDAILAAGRGSLPEDAREELQRLLPWPLYLWGFDSI